MPRFIDLTGHRYGKLVVIQQGASAFDGSIQWECECDCGGTKTIRANSLRSRKGTKSCGCLVRTDSGPQVTIRKLRERIKELELLCQRGLNKP